MAVRNRHHAIASHLLAAGALPNLSMQNLRYVNNSSLARVRLQSVCFVYPDPVFLMHDWWSRSISCVFFLVVASSRIRLYCCKLYKYFKKIIYLSVADPGCLSWVRFFFHPGSESFSSRIRIKEFKCFNPNKLFLSSRKYDSGCSSRIRILIFYPSQIPDPGVEKAPDPESGSATLIYLYHISWYIFVFGLRIGFFSLILTQTPHEVWQPIFYKTT